MSDPDTTVGHWRVMDCLDCHNRPSHKYRTPDELTNRLLSLDLLDWTTFTPLFLSSVKGAGGAATDSERIPDAERRHASGRGDDQ